MAIIVCRPKSLSVDRLEAATRRAIEVNPANAMEERQVSRTPTGRRGGGRRIAVVVGRKWPTAGVNLSVSFLDNAPKGLRTRILSHMNAWGLTANVKFSETAGVGQVRIARLDAPDDMAGYWSYLGTEILEVPDDEPTLNLEGFTTRTSDAEFRRVVRHEAGHTLGFDHEHMRRDLVARIDRAKAIRFYDVDQGWTTQEVEEQVLTPLSSKSIMGTTESDPLSIMCYHIPGKITKNGKPITGGKDINPRDATFAGLIYPKESAERRAAAETPALPNVVPAVAPVVARPQQSESDVFHLVVMDEFQPDRDSKTSGAPQSPRFARVLATYAGARVEGAMRLRAQKGEARTSFGEIIKTHERIKAYTNREHGTLPTDVELQAFGAQLFDAIFQGDVRRLYDEARTRQHSRRLDFVLTSMIPWIAEKPWEFAYDSGRQSFLATEDIHFVRNVLTNVPADPIRPITGPIKILVASAQPVGFGRLSIDQETTVIRRGFEPLIEAGLVEVTTLPRAMPRKLHELLSTGTFNVVHFIGHGVYDTEKGEGCLVFEDERGGEFMLGARSIREIFGNRGLSLVFLNACESGRGGRADFNKGVAQTLVAHGLPALVANQYSVLDASATSFAQHFYWSLAQGLTLGEAARESRIAVNYSLQGEPIDWAIPVMYARDPNRALCPTPGVAALKPATRARAGTRSAAVTRNVRIAVWDIDNVFPALQHTIDVMNGVQQEFGFELIDTSAPLGIWDLDSASNSGQSQPYLHAEKLAKRMRSKAVELRVDLLACVTRHWLRNDDWLNLYGWWGERKKEPLAIFSCAGFDELPVEGTETDRALANATVTMLAGYFGDLTTHATGPQSCAMYFNEARDYQHLIGQLNFHKACRDSLRPKLKGLLPALESLLQAFP